MAIDTDGVSVDDSPERLSPRAFRSRLRSLAVRAARRPSRATLLETAILVAVTAVALRGMAPGHLLRDALPWGGDHAGDPVVPWLIREELLPHGQLAGWTDAWFGGFPVNVLYPALPNLLVAAASFVLPLAVAYKLAVVAGIVLLPPTLWWAARRAGLPRPFGVLLAVLSLPGLFDTGCEVCGGNVASVLNGQYAFQLGLVLAVAALGAVDRLLRTGSGAVLTAVLASATLLCHPLPAIWLALGALVLVPVYQPWRLPAAGQVLAATAVTTLIGLSWWLPFLAWRSWMTSPDFSRAIGLRYWLLPGNLWWQIVLAGVALAGAVVAFRRGRWFLVSVAVLTVLAGCGFVLLPQGQLFNPRVLPFWVLGRWVLVGAALAELATTAPAAWSRLRLPGRGPAPSPAVAVPVVAVLVVVAWNALTYGWLPGTTVTVPTMGQDGRAGAGGLTVPVTRLASWPAGIMAGYESRPDYPELRALTTMLDRAGRDHGCGRVAWDHTAAAFHPEGSPFGDDAVLQRIPMWTGGCLTALSGSQYDESATTPAILLAESLVSQSRLQWKAGLPYQQPDLSAGVGRLQELGVRYYLTHGGVTADAAAADSRLTQVASAGRWVLWQLRDAAIVAPLHAEPVVVTGLAGEGAWQPVEIGYGAAATAAELPLTADGPANWIHVGFGIIPAPRPVQPASVTAVQVSGDRISFHTDLIGSPILVRVSAFPGWQVTGATGPYRATPNFMVVVPTAHDVVLSRGHTAVGLAATACLVGGLLGLAALAAPAVTGRRRRRS